MSMAILGVGLFRLRTSHLSLTLVGLNVLTQTIMNRYFNSLIFIALFYFHALK